MVEAKFLSVRQEATNKQEERLEWTLVVPMSVGDMPGAQARFNACTDKHRPNRGWRRLLRVPGTAGRSKQSILKEINWIFTGRTEAEAEAPILWQPDGKSWFIGKDPDAGKDWGQEEKGTTENEMAGWHHWFNGHECEQTPGDGEGQGSHGVTKSDTTQLSDWTTTAIKDRGSFKEKNVCDNGLTSGSPKHQWIILANFHGVNIPTVSSFQHDVAWCCVEKGRAQ